MSTGDFDLGEDSSGPTVEGEFAEAWGVSVLIHEFGIVLEEVGFCISRKQSKGFLC